VVETEELRVGGDSDGVRDGARDVVGDEARMWSKMMVRRGCLQ
jgi:hypothetical protein